MPILVCPECGGVWAFPGDPIHKDECRYGLSEADAAKKMLEGKLSPRAKALCEVDAFATEALDYDERIKLMKLVTDYGVASYEEALHCECGRGTPRGNCNVCDNDE